MSGSSAQAPGIALPGHRAVVIGAAGAIGAAVCRALADAGAQVLAADLRGAAAVAEGLAGPGHRAIDLDVTDPASVEACAAAAFVDGPVGSVVYAAGSNTTGPVTELAWSDYDRVMAVNLRGAFHVAQAFGRQLVAQAEDASVVLLASTAGQRGEAGGSVYCASKFALLGLNQSLAAEWAPAGVRVNAVCPGNVDSPMLTHLAEAVARREGVTAAEVLAQLAAEAASGRLVRVDEVAQACLWLVSPWSSAVTGTTVNVDAGVLVG